MSTPYAYVAGFFDGEGCVFIQGSGGLEVRISQVDRRPLDIIEQAFGGSTSFKSGNGVRADYYQWRIMRWEEGVAFLRVIHPYVIVKREQMDLVLEHYEQEKAEHPDTAFRQHSGVRFTPERRARRFALKQALHGLKGNRSRVPSLLQKRRRAAAEEASL